MPHSEVAAIHVPFHPPPPKKKNRSVTKLISTIVNNVHLYDVYQAIVGDKYGYRPIPSSIKEDLFSRLAETAKEKNQHDDGDEWKLVDEWYIIDENAIPATRTLLPISSKLTNYNSVSLTKIRPFQQTQELT